MADVIQANYESLNVIARSFAQHATKVRQMQGRLSRQMAVLRPAWTGRGSEAFFAEMSDKVLPAVQRLSAALTEADRVTRQIQEILRRAEEQGATPFRQDAEQGTTGGPDMESGIPPASGAPMGGIWETPVGDIPDVRDGMGEVESSLPADRDGIFPNEVIVGDGFGNPGDGFGDDGITWPGDSSRDDFLVPEDWLSQVKEEWGDSAIGGVDNGGASGETQMPGASASPDTGGGGGGGAGDGSGGISALGQATGSDAAGGETAGMAGSTGGAGAGSPLAGSGSPSGAAGPFAATGLPRGQEGSLGESSAAGSLPAPLRYQPSSDATTGRMDVGRTDAQTAGGTVATGSSSESQVGRANLGLPIGLAALGPLVALLGKAIRDRFAER